MITYLCQTILGKWIAGAVFLLIRCGIKIIRSRPYSHLKHSVSFFRFVFFNAVVHAFVAAVKPLFFIEVNVKNICSFNHENRPVNYPLSKANGLPASQTS